MPGIFDASAFSKRTDWRDEDFSHSVPYFPLVGLVIGFLLAAVNYSLFYIETPLFLRVTLLLLAEIIITGGLMYDGFMDTADGVFSARSRERMLEIMKDSHVGSNAVLAIIILLLLKIAAYLELSGETLTWVLLTMSVATRTFMVVFIVNFPYARKEGIGICLPSMPNHFIRILLLQYAQVLLRPVVYNIWRWQEYVLLSL
mgnify:CR=1 FL=1